MSDIAWAIGTPPACDRQRADGSGVGAGRVAGPGMAGVVSRPGLFEWLEGAARVTVVSAPAGTGKTVLLRSWIRAAGLAERAAWVPAGRDERDPQRFWLSVLGALRQTSAGSALVRELTAAPDLDGWAIVERLLNDLAPLEDRLWLVIDDVHELDSAEVLRQLELLVMRAPQELRFMLATRHDVRLGLHRLRLEGELTEIRADDLRFSLAEARELLAVARVRLTDPVLAVLVDRTEGWAAGLRLAALSLAGHPDPERFAAEFSGSERTVAEYLLAEVLDRQGEEVRRLLLRTSVLERVNGELADLLTGGNGGERVLHDLERVGAFVVPLDAPRSWFRYHRLFADLLQLQLRRTEPGEVAALHELAAGWFAEHGFPVEAIRHAQAARDWGQAARLLADHWPGLHLDGQAATVHALLAGFPAGAHAADAELAALAAADELAQRSLEAAERYLGLAERGSAPVPAGRGRQAQVLLGVVRLLLARQRGNPSAVAEQAQRLQALAEAAEAAQPGLDDELRALALVSLGVTELWAAPLRGAERLAGRQAAPYLLVWRTTALLLHTLVRLGDTERAEQALAGLGERDRDRGEIRIAIAALRLAQDDPDAASAALAPVLDESAPVTRPTWLVHAFMLEAIARDALGDPAAGRSVERALDLAEPDGALAVFLLYPAPGLLERQARQRTAHAALIAQILYLLAGNRPAPPPAGPRPPREPLSKSEIRVLRYLPTHLSAPEIAGELSVSTSTVKTHLRNLYTKLGAHSRAEAVESARVLGLLAPSARSPAPA